jgi:hypothetical protein
MSTTSDRDVGDLGVIDYIIAGKPENLTFNSVINFPNSHPVPMNPFRPTTESSVGLFERIPYELQQLVLLCLDLKSLAALRLTNAAFKTIVDSCPAYIQTVKYAPHALRALRQTKTDSYHPIETIHRTLTSWRCELCCGFGTLLFLLTCQRVCFNCVLRGIATRLVARSDAKHWYGIDPNHINHLPSLATIPGTYAVGGAVVIKHREDLVLHSSVFNVSLKIHGGKAAMDAHLRRIGIESDAAYVRQVNEWVAEWPGNSEIPEAPGDPLSCLYPEPCLDNLGDAEIFNELDRYHCVGATAFPVLDPVRGQIEKGIWCIGCEKALESFDEYGGLMPYLLLEKAKLRAWSREGFTAHVNWCSDGARRQLAELTAEAKRSEV